MVLEIHDGELQHSVNFGVDLVGGCIFGDAVDADHVFFGREFVDFLHGQLEEPYFLSLSPQL